MSPTYIPVFPSIPRAVSRPTRAEINLDALHRNAMFLSSHLRGGAKLLAVLKADAYGHGAVGIARALTQPEYSAAPEATTPDVTMLGVASVDEGAQLREAGITAPILLLSAILPDEAEPAISYDLTPTIFSDELARACDDAARKHHKTADYHFKIDVGMNRLGARAAEAAPMLRQLHEYSHLKLRGIYTHFPCADEADENITRRQCETFRAVLNECAIDTTAPAEHRVLIHAANSAATLRFAPMHFDLARTGLALYGLNPCEELSLCEENAEYSLRPVMTLRSRLTHWKWVERGETVSYGGTWRAPRRTKIGIVPVGYADGYPRRSSGQARVLINGAACDVVGRVTMDQIIVDCTDLENVKIGDDVVLFGEGEITAHEVAGWAQTISYEVMCGIAPRVPRVPVRDNAALDNAARDNAARNSVKNGQAEYSATAGGRC